MTHLCAERTPLGISASIGEFDKVEGVLDVGLKPLYGHMCLGIVILELASEAAA